MAKTLENMDSDELVEYNQGIEEDMGDLREKRGRVQRLLRLQMVREGKSIPKLEELREDDELMDAYVEGDAKRRERAAAALDQAQEESE